MVVVGGKPLKRLAEELGCSPFLIRRRFIEWCELNGKDYEDYKVTEWTVSKGRLIPNVVVLVPKEAEEWIRQNVNDRRIRNSYKVLKRGKNAHHNLRGNIVTASAFARRLGVSHNKVLREFKWWCYIHKRKKEEFYKPGVGYVLPKEFVEYMKELVKKFKGV